MVRFFASPSKLRYLCKVMNAVSWSLLFKNFESIGKMSMFVSECRLFYNLNSVDSFSKTLLTGFTDFDLSLAISLFVRFSLYSSSFCLIYFSSFLNKLENTTLSDLPLIAAYFSEVILAIYSLCFWRICSMSYWNFLILFSTYDSAFSSYIFCVFWKLNISPFIKVLSYWRMT